MMLCLLRAARKGLAATLRINPRHDPVRLFARNQIIDVIFCACRGDSIKNE